MANELELLIEMFKHVDSLIKKNEFAKVNHLLEEVKVNEKSLYFLEGYLLITHDVQKELSYYPTFYEKVKAECLERGRLPEKIISGLEPKGYYD